MLEKMSEFYEKLPKRVCLECGKEIEEEMYDCYIGTCDVCIKFF